MSDSIIQPSKRGSGIGCEADEPVFKMTIKDTKLNEYYFIATDLSWGETDNTVVTQTVGGDIFMYCTGGQPVTLSLTGAIIYPACEGKTKKFRDFWKYYRIGTKKELLEITLDEDVYHMALISYVRQPTSKDVDLDIAKMTFIGTASK